MAMYFIIYCIVRYIALNIIHCIFLCVCIKTFRVFLAGISNKTVK